MKPEDRANIRKRNEWIQATIEKERRRKEGIVPEVKLPPINKTYAARMPRMPRRGNGFSIRGACAGCVASMICDFCYTDRTICVNPDAKKDANKVREHG